MCFVTNILSPTEHVILYSNSSFDLFTLKQKVDYNFGTFYPPKTHCCTSWNSCIDQCVRQNPPCFYIFYFTQLNYFFKGIFCKFVNRVESLRRPNKTWVYISLTLILLSLQSTVTSVLHYHAENCQRQHN